MKGLIKGLSLLVCGLLFCGCAAKDLKEAGGNIAFNNGSGNAIGMIGGLIVGGTMYGVGVAMDSNKEKEFETQAKSKELQFEKAKEWDLANNTNVPVSNTEITGELDKNGIKSVEIPQNKE